MNAVIDDGTYGMSHEEAEDARYLQEMTTHEIDAQVARRQEVEREQAAAQVEMEAYWKAETTKLHGEQAKMSYSDWVF
jgi:hypothetical protein